MDINEIIRQVTEEICAKYGASGVASANDGMDPAGMAKYIDHTYLKPEASLEDIRRICDEAKKYHTASVCVNPSYVKFVAEQLEGFRRYALLCHCLSLRHEHARGKSL